MDSHSTRQLVGRETELARLDAALDALDDGRAGCLTVEGEPGIGKTRLLGELRARAEERRCIVLSGAAAEFERGVPFSVWVDALDAYVISQDLPTRADWDPELERELGRVLPSFGKGRSDAVDGAAADERYRAHRAVSRLLAILADSRPLVLILDDLHWADDASTELIAALVRRAPAAPVLFALGLRPAQAGEGLIATWSAPSLMRIELGPLSQAEAALLLDGLDPDSAAAAYRRGGGNPFYLEQLGRAGAPALAEAEVTGAAVPPAVAASIAAELALLSPRSRAFLDGAAVAGEPFEPDLAAHVGELPPQDGLVALDELLELDLLRPTAVPRRFRFRHPLVRSAVYESTRGGWRLAAHARAARALAERGADRAEQAAHVERCAGLGDEDAIALLLAAADDAASRAPAASVRWLEAALRLLPTGDAARQVDVRKRLASALRSSGRLDTCRDTLLEAIALLAPGDVAQRVELTTLCAAVEQWQGRHEDAHRRLTRARKELPGGATREAAALELELAADGLYTLDFEQSRTSGEAALAAAQTLGDELLVATATTLLALTEASSGAMEIARAHRDAAAAAVDAQPDTLLAQRLETLFYLGWAETYLELYDEAIAHAERGVEIARAAGVGQMLVPLMLVRGFPLQMQGRIADSAEVAETAIEVARLSGNPHYLYWALFEAGWAHYYAGDLDRAIGAAEESLRVDSRLLGGTMPSAGGGPGWLHACAQLEAGSAAAAREALRAIAGTDLQVAVQRCFDIEVMALAELALGDVEAAARHADEAEADAARLGTRLAEALAARTRAAVLLAQGEAGSAAAAAERAVAAAGAIGAALQVAYARVVQGRALAAAGAREEAVAVLREAERELDAFGSLRVRDEARRELRKLGARAEPRGPAAGEDAGIGALTERELEIAELITDRLTNGQIAERLFLSKKTIESHIRNLFIKLGAGSRVEVARMVEADRRRRAAA